MSLAETLNSIQWTLMRNLALYEFMSRIVEYIAIIQSRILWVVSSEKGYLFVYGVVNCNHSEAEWCLNRPSAWYSHLLVGKYGTLFLWKGSELFLLEQLYFSNNEVFYRFLVQNYLIVIKFKLMHQRDAALAFLFQVKTILLNVCPAAINKWWGNFLG